MTVSIMLNTNVEPSGGYANFGFLLASWPAAPDTKKAAPKIARMLVAMLSRVGAVFEDISGEPVFRSPEQKSI